MEVKKELLDELIKGYEKPEDLIGETGLLKQLTKALIERAMNAELTFWLGQTEVTQAAWKKVNGSNPSSFKSDQLPVEKVDWTQAEALQRRRGPVAHGKRVGVRDAGGHNGPTLRCSPRYGLVFRQQRRDDASLGP